ncbi:helix-turn-helix domain-containing protein [Streptomyces brasiliensis]|uniref:helix-turn-helix domain-containing protein n=1 Tax=Streptomyces brasiliensis TaxID=1954 RepID=UPI001E3D86A0|nr:helix-turn-helix domain-containing protein [Streptomyces brasiliensis]
MGAGSGEPVPQPTVSYESGTSTRAIAEATGRSYGGVHQLLAHAGVQFLPRGGTARDATASTDAS